MDSHLHTVGYYPSLKGILNTADGIRGAVFSVRLNDVLVDMNYIHIMITLLSMLVGGVGGNSATLASRRRACQPKLSTCQGVEGVLGWGERFEKDMSYRY